MESSPILPGVRTVLRPWSEDDLAFVMSVADDPVIPLISEVPSTPEVFGAKAFVAAQQARRRDDLGWSWAVVPRDMEVVVGYVGALWVAKGAGRATIGYWTSAGNRRNGLTGEAVSVAADWLLTEGRVVRLEAFIEPGNVGSIRVAERAGFEREGLMKSFAPLGGRRVDAYLYARTAQ